MSTGPLVPSGPVTSGFAEALLATQTGPQALATLRFDATHTGLAFGGTLPAVRVYALGPASLARHWHPGFPTAAQLEYTIAAVEDELMRVHRHCGPPPPLASAVCPDPPLRALAASLGLPVTGRVKLLRETVEHGFGRLAACAEGRLPGGDGLPQDAGGMALLLILRELMHHLPLAALDLPA